MSALLLDIAARHFDPNPHQHGRGPMASHRELPAAGLGRAFSPNTQRHHVLTRSFMALVR